MVKMSGAFRNVNSIQQLNELTQALTGTLEGMKTAFACTLAGLIAAVVLSILTHGVRRGQSGLIRQLEEYVTCELMPALEGVDPESDGAARAFAQILNGATEKLGALGDSLVAAAGRYENSTLQLSQTAVSLNGVIGELASATKELTAHHATLAGHQADQARHQETFDTRLKTLEDVSRASQVVQDSIARHDAQLAGFMQGHQEQLRGFIDQNTKHLEQALKQLLGNVDHHYRSDVRQHVEESQKRLEQVITDNKAAFSEVLATHSARLAEFSQMVWDSYGNGGNGQPKEGRA